jgi:hypothetical protein
MAIGRLIIELHKIYLPNAVLNNVIIWVSLQTCLQGNQSLGYEILSVACVGFIDSEVVVREPDLRE